MFRLICIRKCDDNEKWCAVWKVADRLTTDTQTWLRYAQRLAECLGHANSPKKYYIFDSLFCSRLSRARKFMKSKRAAVKKVIRKLRCALQLRPSFLWSFIVSPVLTKYANKKTWIDSVMFFKVVGFRLMIGQYAAYFVIFLFFRGGYQHEVY